MAVLPYQRNTNVLYIATQLQYTVNRERFAGLNFCVFHGFQEHHESFPMNIIQASYNGIV